MSVDGKQSEQCGVTEPGALCWGAQPQPSTGHTDPSFGFVSAPFPVRQTQRSVCPSELTCWLCSTKSTTCSCISSERWLVMGTVFCWETFCAPNTCFHLILLQEHPTWSCSLLGFLTCCWRCSASSSDSAGSFPLLCSMAYTSTEGQGHSLSASALLPV